MSIKISEFMTTNATLTEDNKRETKSTAQTLKAKLEEPVQQTVHLSTQAQQLALAPHVDIQKVESIKSRIAENKYEVNTKSIAERILSLEKDMFGKK
jgi:flagellar biosynthesis anti-sigma factor FlgM